MKRYFIFGIFLIFSLTMGFGAIATAEASDSSEWKTGRAKVEKNGSALILRLSLRNEGKPDRNALTILGKWKGSGSKYKKLGNYNKEVALKQTAIIMVPLKPLGSPPSGKAALEISLKTGSQKTDHQVINMQ